MVNLTDNEVRVWGAILRNRAASAEEIAAKVGCTPDLVEGLMGRISSPNWREEASPPPRSTSVGESGYHHHTIQPWDIWLEYNLNPWDADIIKRVLRDKPGQRRLDYEKIKHVCDERIRQLDAAEKELDDVDMAQEEGADSQIS